MRGMNRVTLMGHVALAPVVGRTPDGQEFAGVVFRTCEGASGQATDGQGDTTEWHRIVVFGGKAKVVAEVLRKGSPAVFEGRLRTRRWKDAGGSARRETFVVCEELYLFYRSGFDEEVPPGLEGEWPGEEIAA